MKKYLEFIKESNVEYSVNLNFKDNKMKFTNNNVSQLYISILEWLYKNGYDFKNNHSSGFTKILSKNDIDLLRKRGVDLKRERYHNIGNSDMYISITRPGNIKYKLDAIEFMLDNFKKKNDELKYYFSWKNTNLDSDNLSLHEPIKKMTFMEAAQYILKKNYNKPMTSLEIWENAQYLVETKGKTPWDSMNAQMILYSENTTAKNKKKNSLFKIIEETKPYKFLLINPDLEIQSVPDEDVILTPSEFIEKKEQPKEYSKNPFRQAICVLGGSGTGKSVTIENILEEEGHEFDQIIPSASTTGLLSQFSPSKSGYVPSKLGKMIVKAYDNPTELFTAVFDECHKSNIIEMINDELLQAISTKRNAGKRFISLDDDTAELYPGTETYRGNILMPDNLGFIFISSKPDVIIHNDDFFNRIDIVLLKSYEEERLSTIDQLLGKVLSITEKDSLKSNNE